MDHAVQMNRRVGDRRKQTRAQMMAGYGYALFMVGVVVAVVLNGHINYRQQKTIERMLEECRGRDARISELEYQEYRRRFRASGWAAVGPAWMGERLAHELQLEGMK